MNYLMSGRTDLQLSLENSLENSPRVWKAGENYKSSRFVKYSTQNVASNNDHYIPQTYWAFFNVLGE